MNRRTFIKQAGITGGVISMSGATFINACSENGYHPFGLQLYTLRDIITGDIRNILKKVSEFGYKQIESYEGLAGMFWGMGSREFKTIVQDLGMELTASHCNMDEHFKAKAEDAASAGIKYLICPWIGHQPTLDAYRDQADLFNKCGEICQDFGIRFAYHNHEYTFEKMEGIYPQEVLMEYTDPELVDFEMDIYWVVTANEDPIKWLNKYPGRFQLSHVKDRDMKLQGSDASVTLGNGGIDIPSILEIARSKGMKYFFVEQERFDGTTPIDAIRSNADYMKIIKY